MTKEKETAKRTNKKKREEGMKIFGPEGKMLLYWVSWTKRWIGEGRESRKTSSGQGRGRRDKDRYGSD